VHNWKEERARTALLTFNLRKKHDFAGRERKTRKSTAVDYHNSRPCPVDKCSAAVKRLSSHLTKFHHLQKNTTLFKTLVSVAKKRNRRQLLEEDVQSESSFASESTQVGQNATEECELSSVESNSACQNVVSDAPGDASQNTSSVPAALPADFFFFLN
jgi:hypothetical protein